MLTPNSSSTKTISIISRENMIDFNNFSYGSAQLALLVAIIVALDIWLGKMGTSGPVIMRQPGKARMHAGEDVSLRPQDGKLYRFDRNGKPI